MVFFFSLKNIKYVILITFNFNIQDTVVCLKKCSSWWSGWLKQGDFLAV